MNLVLQRFSDNRKSTLGLLFKKSAENNRLIFLSYTLEDEYRDVKLQKETRIPAGFYELGLQMVDTDKTKAYRERYPWFQNHIMIKNVKDFTGVYIHVGNTDADTDGCILLGDNADNNNLGFGSISNSKQAFKRFYDMMHDHLLGGGKAFIEIRNEDFLLRPI